LSKTNHLLSADSAILFEAAIRFGDLFARVDILKKTPTNIELIEVKAKSFDPTGDEPFNSPLPFFIFF